MSLYASFLPVTHQVHKEDNVLHTLAFEVQVTSSYLKLSQVFEGGATSIHWKFFFQLYGNDSLYL